MIDSEAANVRSRVMAGSEEGDCSEEGDSSAARGPLLLAQLDRIFVSDPLINELGFVHPTQLTTLHSPEDAAADDVPKPKTTNGPRSRTSASSGGKDPDDDLDCPRQAERGGHGSAKGDLGVPYDTTAFWCGDHKLAISMAALAPMYKCAKGAFVAARAEYSKLLKKEQRGSGENLGLRSDGVLSAEDSLDETSTLGAEKLRLENSLLSYSRALVLINCDYASAWGTRKQILLRKRVNEDVLWAELQMAGIVLSWGPKSEETWAYRRSVINHMIKCGVSRADLDSILEGESKIVEGVAERSVMNYRAWRHRCWLVPQMSALQLAIELHRTKAWASAHVSDNCCFHYRRSLLLQLMKARITERNVSTTAAEKGFDLRSLSVSLLDGTEARVLWKEEMDWIKNLIHRFIGREALWIHLRFLLHSWIQQIDPILSCSRGPSLSPMSRIAARDAQDNFLTTDNEQKFAEGCLSTCVNSLTEEANRQREFAAAYKLWTVMLGLRKWKGDGKTGRPPTDQDDLQRLELLLHDVVPHRKELWKGLVGSL